MYHLIRNEVKLLLDPDTRAFYKSRGWTLERWLEQWVGLEKAAMEGFDDVAFSLHVCRGNQYSRWLVSGGLRDPGKASIFPRPRAQRLRLEYEDTRSGTPEPLGQVPEEKTVVHGAGGDQAAHSGGPVRDRGADPQSGPLSSPGAAGRLHPVWLCQLYRREPPDLGRPVT